MRRFRKNTKGAVTVFVTLLLVPAILISGTAVDLARIHTARSIASDANQLAANSMLSQYDALLHDLYGLFGIMAGHPELAEMLNDYIEITIFGGSGYRSGLGTLQVFYGSNLQPAELLPAPEKNLSNTDVLRRQIEEYMKFRGPAIIVNEFLDTLDNNTLRADAAVIGEKLEVDSAIADMYDLYTRLYDAITAADRCNQAIGGIAGGHFGAVSTSLVAIQRQFADLQTAHTTWESAGADTSTTSSQLYIGILQNIKSLTVGGPRGSNWGAGGWQTIGNVAGLNSNIANAKIQADNFKPRFDLVVSIAREIDDASVQLEQRINALENRLNSSGVGADLRGALTQPGPDGKSQIDRYRELLMWSNIEAMAAAFSDGGYDYIDIAVKPLLDSVKYRNVNNESAGSLTREQLDALPADPGFALSNSASGERVSRFAGFPEDSVTYKMPPGFLKFAEYPGDNHVFFQELSLMMSASPLDPVILYDGQETVSDSNPERGQRTMIGSLLSFVQTAYNGLANDPLGARYLSSPGAAATESLNIINILSLIPEAISAPMINIISDPRGSAAEAGDYLLLLTYSTSMFSNYTATKPESIGLTRENLNQITFTRSISGVPISPEVNYFFQSEWEYLYNGRENAGQNLSAITRLLFLTRLVSNYITVFSVAEVTTVVMNIKAAFAWNPPLAIILAELARAAFTAAETVVDVAALRSGHRVPLFKNAAAGQWVCTPNGLMSALNNVISGGTFQRDGFSNQGGLSYSNYMIFFFITKAVFSPDAAEELTKRTGDLIEWNIINYRSNANADEGRMASALSGNDRFRLLDMKTDFSIGFTVDLRMLFLSMPLAQRGINSVIPPGTMPMTIVDYRGY